MGRKESNQTNNMYIKNGFTRGILAHMYPNYSDRFAKTKFKIGMVRSKFKVSEYFSQLMRILYLSFWRVA